ncbi:MAG: hypothetical protein LC777_17435 [Actinobacteria bacterium]|nr:hypothetical protein [Actinomycetota bacterium]
MATAEHQRWTQNRVARELEAWFAQRCFDNWPPYSAFLRDRRRPLYVALLRHGGPQHWAQELGVAFIVRHPGPQHSQADVRERLRALYRQHRFKRFPSERWLRAHGPRGLVEQIKRSGGARHWARELGVPGPQPARWTDELIEAELVALCAHKSMWPTKAEFAQAGLCGLLAAVRRGHGSAWWAGHLGLPQRRRSPARS